MPDTLPSLKAMLAELIATPSVSSTLPSCDMGNRAVIDKLAGWLETLGFAVQILALPGKPHKANLVATLGSGPGGLVLAGHTDTVPFNEERWQLNPLALTERDNRFYGLGSTDMKGFFPIALEAARGLAGQPLRQPLIVLATADEESSMDGARALAAQGFPEARYAVIGEPTGLRPVRMHKGMMMESVVISGRAGHSSNPLLGNSALEAMQEVMTELLALRGELQQRYRHPGFDIPQPTLNLGCIHGGDNPNRICGQCELQFDLRPLPGMEPEALRAELRSRLLPVAERRAIAIALHTLMPGILPFEESAQSELVQAVEQLSGHAAESVAFATEAPFLQALGMQTVVMGPGSIDQAHQPDEYLALEQVQPAINLLKGLIRRFCL